MAPWNDGYICNNLICKPTVMTMASLEASLDSPLDSYPHASWQQPCQLYHLWLEIAPSRWCAKVSPTSRVTRKMNVCHQTPIVKIKQTSKKKKNHLCFPSSLMANQSTLLMSHCSKVGEQSSQSMLLSLPMESSQEATSSHDKYYSNRRGRQPSQACALDKTSGRTWMEEEAYN